ncbi:hypothetical protein JB92DRAFT_2873924 [Gautieria morchelliformis]|nr:hypothetical protein JB92DRAFT_2873924 [Gautieria morchelliformis]
MMTPTSFRSLIRFYSFVPITAFSAILFFIALRSFLWPAPDADTDTFALHLGLAVLGAAAWTVSFALRVPVYLLSSLGCRTGSASTPFVAASFQVFIEECLRLASLILARLSIRSKLRPEDPAFSRVWTLALGWAAAEVAVSVYQGYGQLFLYSDITSFNSLDPRRFPHLTDADLFYDTEDISIEEIDQILRIRARTELEALFGIPVPDIPVFVSCLLRIDSITLSVALFLIISSSYLPNLVQSLPAEKYFLQAIRATLPIFLVVFVLRTVLSFSWTVNVLPRMGLHAASYMSCMFALGAFFVGLGRWDAV